MVLINNTLIDQYGRAIPAAMVWIRDDEGALVDLDDGNPVITDSVGYWTADLDPGTYELVFTKGDDFISREQFVCGDETTETRRGIANALLGWDSSYRASDRSQLPGWFNEATGTRQSARNFATCTIS